MARPITWQDVQYRGNAAAIEAFGRGGDRVADAFKNIGQIAVDYRNDKIKTATDAAVAGIANSDDPLAAAAALPKDWTIDPLQVAVAANTREGQIFNRKVGESNLRENEAQISKMDLEREEFLSDRQIATKVQQYEPLARKGQEFEVDDADPFWKTNSGFKALTYLNGLRDTAINQNLDREKVSLQGRQARAAEEQLKMAQSQLNARDQYVNWLQTDGAGSSPAEQQRMGRIIGQQTGAGEAFGSTLPGTYQSTRGLATSEELASRDVNGVVYGDAIGALRAANEQQEAEKAVALKDLELAAAGAQAIINPNYKGLTGEAVNVAVLKNNPDMANGEGWFRFSKDTQDVQDARDEQLAQAKIDAKQIAQDRNWPIPGKDFVPLLPEQEAALAELVLAGNNDAAASLRQQFVAYNLVGGDKGLAVETQKRQGRFDAVINRNNQEITRVEGAAINQKPVSKTAVDTYKRTPEGQLWDKTRNRPWDFVERSLQSGTNQR